MLWYYTHTFSYLFFFLVSYWPWNCNMFQFITYISAFGLFRVTLQTLCVCVCTFIAYRIVYVCAFCRSHSSTIASFFVLSRLYTPFTEFSRSIDGCVWVCVCVSIWLAYVCTVHRLHMYRFYHIHHLIRPKLIVVFLVSSFSSSSSLSIGRWFFLRSGWACECVFTHMPVCV